MLHLAKKFSTCHEMLCFITMFTGDLSASKSERNFAVKRLLAHCRTHIKGRSTVSVYLRLLIRWASIEMNTRCLYRSET